MAPQMDTFSEIKMHIARADRNFLRSYYVSLSGAFY